MFIIYYSQSKVRYMMLPNLSNLMNLERPRLEGEDIDYIVSPSIQKENLYPCQYLESHTMIIRSIPCRTIHLGQNKSPTAQEYLLIY